MSEDFKEKLRRRALNYYYEHGGTSNQREAHGAAGHFVDGARWTVEQIASWLESDEADQLEKERDCGRLNGVAWAAEIRSRFGGDKE